MTPEELELLTSEQKRKRISRICDWKANYLHDLNAMRYAEKCLTESQRRVYVVALCNIVHPGALPMHILGSADALWAFRHATAAQLADAFLLAVEVEEPVLS